MTGVELTQEERRSWRDAAENDHVGVPWMYSPGVLRLLNALDAVEAERDRMAEALAAAPSCEAQMTCRALARAEAAEAEVARLTREREAVEALAAKWEAWNLTGSANMWAPNVAADLRAALASASSEEVGS